MNRSSSPDSRSLHQALNAYASLSISIKVSLGEIASRLNRVASHLETVPVRLDQAALELEGPFGARMATNRFLGAADNFYSAVGEASDVRAVTSGGSHVTDGKLTRRATAAIADANSALDTLNQKVIADQSMKSIGRSNVASLYRTAADLVQPMK